MEAAEAIVKQAELIEMSDVYFVLKKMKVRFLSEDQQKIVRLMLALRKMGIASVPSTLVASLYGTSQQNVVSILHKLGDKGVLILVQNHGPGALRYVLSQKFVDLWEATHEKLNQQL